MSFMPACTASHKRALSTVFVTAISLMSVAFRPDREAFSLIVSIIREILAAISDSMTSPGEFYCPCAFQQIYRLAERKADHIRIGTGYPAYEKGASTLEGITSCLVIGFVCPHIPVYFFFGEALKKNRRYNSFLKEN